ncbi:Wzz/FepE/Etk N-terminal domain-containing protein [Acrocarpospora catenulata]|uniref:Wzz/FepE/Etk N-terminal domain-containing protein n=1 Tax=Acrocarpospora catenulata TaxID=2836182 RepID=UPI001BD9E5AE|nr:Wzz/FepE/Etk N-terminal domain-containing protein [Acrocarpospora catenulata]
MSLSPHSRDLAEYLGVFRRRWLSLLFCLVAWLAAGAGAVFLLPSAYTSAAEVQVVASGVAEPGNLVTQRQRESLNLDTEAQIVQSSVVATQAAQTLNYPDVEGLRDRVRVDVPPNSGILRISFTAPDAASAAAGAQAFAEAYLKHRAAAATETLSVQMNALIAKLRQVNASLTKAAGEVATLPRASAARSLALHQQSMLARQATTLALRYDTLKTTPITPGTVISPARPPATTSSPRPPIYLGGALFLGLLTGVVLAFARESR